MPCTLNLAEFNNKFNLVAKEAFENLGDSIQANLIEEVRPFPRSTERKFGLGITGKNASSPRDVVDSRELVESYDLGINNGLYQTTATYSYNCAHAIYVYLGWITRTGQDVPPYPWILNAMPAFLPEFEEAWNARG
jgi:hypothetical protein